MIKKRIITDAPESNAGDDFHVLWAVRKSVELINFKDDGLKALTLEGAVTEDAQDVDPDGDKLLGVDLGEYFGGENFAEAAKLIFSQLKYSTRHSSTPWTIASICQGKKKKYAGSIIHRLAEIFTSHESGYGRSAVLDKLRLKLISNRPFADDSAKLIDKAQEELQKHPGGLTLAKLRSALDESLRADIDKLHAASGLTACKFTDFLRLLDFTDCGAASRHVLQEDVINAIAAVNGVESSRNYDSLHVKVWNKMMPENRKNNKFTIIDILKVFNFSTPEKLLPVPSRLDATAVLIPRLQLGEIITAIREPDNTPLCLHAGAGMGKTSMLKLIEAELPAGFMPLIFDCYGAGSYLDVIDKRHKHDWAVMQICNELAIKTGSPFFLMPAGQPVEVLLRALLDRLKIAGEIVQKVHADARVIIVIDAADNSVTAAEQSSESSFVTDLVKLTMPPGCLLVLTTRTHRLNSLTLPSNTRLIEIKPFEPEETTMRLTAIFPEATAEQAAQFHLLTKGIPRVQTYALANQAIGLEGLLKPLKPNGKTVDDLILANLKYVSSKLGDKALVDQIFRFMILLPRPVPLWLLSKLAGTSEAVITDVVTDTAQGIFIKNDVLVFTDEDFESYLRQTYPAGEEHHTAVADQLLAHADTDEYASKHIGNFLLLTQKYEQLKDIVFNQKHLLVPKDPVILKEISVERTRQAMKLSLKEKSGADFLKLQVIAAEAAKTNDKLTETLLTNADLTARYGDRQTVENLYFKSDKLTWYGPVHFRCAAVYARDPETLTEAKAHYKAAASWLDWRNRQENNELHNYRITAEDFAFAGEAICRLESVQAAMEWLLKNSYFRLDLVTKLMLQNLIDHSDIKEVNKAVNSLNWKLASKLNIISVYFTSGAQVPFATKGLIDEFENSFKGRHVARPFTKQKLIATAEYLARNGEEPAKLQQLLVYSLFKNPESFPHFYASNFGKDKEFVHLDVLFRVKALISALNDTPMKVEEFYPERFKKIENKEFKRTGYEREEKARLDDFYAAVLPFYRLRAKFICGKIDEAAFLTAFKAHNDSFYRNYRIYSYHRELTHFKTYYATIFSDICVYLKDKQTYVKLLLDCFAIKDNAIAVRLGVAGQIAHARSAHTMALSLLKEADTMIFDAQTDASGKISDFLHCVRIGGKLDRSVGQAYFKRMVETVAEMDIEGFDQIRFVNGLSKTVTGRYPETAYNFSRFVEYAHSRLKNWDHFPWSEAISGTANLDSIGVLALICRWDHLRFTKLEHYILPALKNGFSKKVITSQIAAAAAYINTDYGENCTQYHHQLFAELKGQPLHDNSAVAKALFKLIRYECPRYHQVQMIKDLRALAAINMPDEQGLLSGMDAFISFHEPVISEDRQAIKICNNDQLNVPENLDPTDVNAVKAYLKSRPRSFGVNENLLETIRETCGISQYIGFLDVILALDGDDIYYYSRQNLLEETLELWKDHPSLADWKTENFEPFFIRSFPAYLAHNDILNTPRLKEIASIFGATDEQLADAVKRILPAYIDTLDAGDIYRLSEFTKYGLNESELIELIDWTLARWNKKITEETLGTKWDKMLIVPDDELTAIGSLFRYLLGHPRLEMRWRAAHGLRLLTDCRDTRILEYLLSLQNETHCFPFQHQAYTYFWISAKVWLWLVLEKLAADTPDTVKHLASFGPATLREEQLPHALIRLKAQKFCLNLIDVYPDIYDQAEVAFIQTVLASPFDADSEQSTPELEIVSKEEMTFDFDNTDTVPYWYQPLDAVFNVSYQTVPSMADQVITVDWGYTGKINEDDHVRGGEDDHYSTANDHGDIPAVENLHKYYEFHAMFCVASKLLKLVPLNDDGQESWQDWLNDWTSTYDGLWLADLRDNVPLEAVLWDGDRPDDWGKEIPVDYPLKFLKFDSDEPVLAGVIKLNYGRDYETMHIESALVTAIRGESLLRSLAMTPAHRYKLPEANDYRQEITEEGFELRGWFDSINGRNQVFDRFDPFANELKHCYIEPGEILNTWGFTSLSPDFRHTLVNERIIATCENWTNTTDHPDHSRAEVNGHRWSFNSQELQAFLNATGYSVILECQVSRRREYNRYDDEDREKPEFKILYLIEADGTIKTVTGNFKLGK